MMRYKLGRRPPVHTGKTMRRALALAPYLDSLGTAPAVCTDYVSAVRRQAPHWGMYMNGPDPSAPPGVPSGELGCCVAADSCHQAMLHSANGGSVVVPTDQDCLALYEAVGGYVVGDENTDQGCDESAMCSYLMQTGVAGQKSSGTGHVDPANVEHIKWCVQIFGACRLGEIVDQQMEEQFNSGEPWTTAAAPNDPNAGGHDTPNIYYYAEYAYVCEGGDAPGGQFGLQPVAWSLIAQPAFLQEAHAEVWADFCRVGGTAPSGFNLVGLIAELARVEMA
ncbi:MAG: hypothetical protein ACRDF8_00795 [Chloroflexota bacterium]